MSVSFFLYPFFLVQYTFPRVNLLGYVCRFLKYLAIFLKSIEIFSTHYSSVPTVPFLRIVRLKDCTQELHYCTVPAKKCPPAKQPSKSRMDPGPRHPPVALHAMYYTRTVFLSTDTLILNGCYTIGKLS